MIRLISWDVGIINLAYCIMEVDDLGNEKITAWKTISLKGDTQTKRKNIKNIAHKLLESVSSAPELIDVDYVLIENQPCMKNPTMKSVQMVLYTFYLMMQKGQYHLQDVEFQISKRKIKDVCLISASNKLKVYDGPKIELQYKSSYTRRKKTAILHTQYLLRDNEEKLKYLDKHKKKDDLCDTYLQAKYFLKIMKSKK